MRGLTASDLLDVYERGRREGTARRALLMLEASGADAEGGGLAGLSVGRRNALLLRLRAATFGGVIDGVATCPACGTRLEFTFDGREVRTDGAEATASGRFESDGFDIRFRLPTAGDLVVVEALQDATAARRTLIARCIEVRRAGHRRSAARLPPSLLERVGEAMAAADPMAIADVTLSCPSCGQEHTASFDIASFLWSEIAARVPRLLAEVHDLAAAYGWGEEQILALTPFRRHAYLALAGP
jgi:hypothetical protein